MTYVVGGTVQKNNHWNKDASSLNYIRQFNIKYKNKLHHSQTKLLHCLRWYPQTNT